MHYFQTILSFFKDRAYTLSMVTFLLVKIVLFQIKNALPHRGCQNLLQSLPGNPDCKLSKCWNPDDFCEIYLEIIEVCDKNLEFGQTLSKMSRNMVKNVQHFLEFQSLKLPRKSGIPTSSIWREGTFYLEEPNV